MSNMPVAPPEVYRSCVKTFIMQLEFGIWRIEFGRVFFGLTQSRWISYDTEFRSFNAVVSRDRPNTLFKLSFRDAI